MSAPHLTDTQTCADLNLRLTKASLYKGTEVDKWNYFEKSDVFQKLNPDMAGLLRKMVLDPVEYERNLYRDAQLVIRKAKTLTYYDSEYDMTIFPETKLPQLERLFPDLTTDSNRWRQLLILTFLIVDFYPGAFLLLDLAVTAWSSGDEISIDIIKRNWDHDFDRDMFFDFFGDEVYGYLFEEEDTEEHYYVDDYSSDEWMSDLDLAKLEVKLKAKDSSLVKNIGMYKLLRDMDQEIMKEL